MANGKCEQARIEQPNARSRALGSVAVMERLGFFRARHQCPLSSVTRKTYARTEFFSVCAGFRHGVRAWWCPFI